MAATVVLYTYPSEGIDYPNTEQDIFGPFESGDHAAIYQRIK